ncbi:MAG: immunity protein 32 [Sphingomonas sp.]|uniref:Imm32 family immunity protein n=1 Tax=Sphingomonas sp. TaxID=28214 RepID=UPI0025DF77D4|nr:Imm32 family immunity protein [Sphingomonas sp.]MBQ1500177.1 immunity protein 32 [Sphingomonas sp.]
MISYELKPVVDGNIADEIEIFVDVDGIDRIIAQLNSLKEGRTDHLHMMSQSWGDGELAGQVVHAGNTSISHVKIYKVV